MINKYLYIPKELESSLTSMQQAWLGSSEKAFTIVTGVYVACQEDEVDESNSTVLNQSKLPISYGNKSTFMGISNFNKLVGFCVEINDTDISFDLPISVVVFDTSNEFLDFINKISNE